MGRKSPWVDEELLGNALRQIAINNGTPNIMPTFEQMSTMHGLASWVKDKGGARRMARKYNLLMRPAVTPNPESGIIFQKQIMRGSMVCVHNTQHVYPALVIDKGKIQGELIVLVLNKRLTRRHVTYGKNRLSKYQWCYARDVPKEYLVITL